MKQKRLPPLPGWKPGFKFYKYGELCHYVGFMYDGDKRIHTYKRWDKYHKVWSYFTLAEKILTASLPYCIPK